jgi:hypothetical protein
MDSTGTILACRCPQCISLDTLYKELVLSGVAGMGEIHSTYARWATGAVTKDRNNWGSDLFGS